MDSPTGAYVSGAGKAGLVLAGGGARAAYQVGVLKAMQGLLAREPRTAIVLTNYGFRQYRDRALSLGAKYFFDKSRDLEEMRKVLVGLAANA